MEQCAPVRFPEPIPLHPSPTHPRDPVPDAADLLRPLVAVLAEIAARVEREQSAAGADAA